MIVGSSNVSRSAFVSNYELNVAFQIPAGGVYSTDSSLGQVN